MRQKLNLPAEPEAAGNSTASLGATSDRYERERSHLVAAIASRLAAKATADSPSRYRIAPIGQATAAPGSHVGHSFDGHSCCGCEGRWLDTERFLRLVVADDEVAVKSFHERL